MKNTLRILAIVTCISMFFTSCKKEIDETNDPIIGAGTNDFNTGSLDLGADVSADFYGQVIDNFGNPVEGVDIKVGDQTTITDDKGTFHITNVLVKEELAYVRVYKSGYFHGSRSLIPDPSITNNILIELMPLNIAGTINSGEEGSISLNSGASVQLKGHYVDANGNPYNGTVSVAMQYLPPFDENTDTRMPGMLYAQNENGDAGALETFGMLAVELIGSNGEQLQIANGSSALVNIPVDAQQVANAPSSIPLWHFDEVAGYWVEEGSANLIGNHYVGVVDHFSFWNWDIYVQECTFFGLLEDQNGNPISYANVTILTNNSQTSGTTSIDGSFGTYLPSNQNVIIEVYDFCGNLIHTQSVLTGSPGSVVNTTITCPTNQNNVVNVIGIAEDCQGNPILDGKVIVDINGNMYSYPISNGQIDFSSLYCINYSTLDLIVIDYGSTQEGYALNVPIISGTANAGTVSTCSNLSEYINMTVDNISELWIAPLDFHEVQDSIGQFIYFQIAGDNGTNGIGFQVSSNQPGSYNLVNNVVVQTGFEFGSNLFHPYIGGVNHSMSFTFSSYPNVGGYIVISITGTYYDAMQDPHVVNANLKVLRDS